MVGGIIFQIENLLEFRILCQADGKQVGEVLQVELLLGSFAWIRGLVSYDYGRSCIEWLLEIEIFPDIRTGCRNDISSDGYCRVVFDLFCLGYRVSLVGLCVFVIVIAADFIFGAFLSA